MRERGREGGKEEGRESVWMRVGREREDESSVPEWLALPLPAQFEDIRRLRPGEEPCRRGCADHSFFSVSLLLWCSFYGWSLLHELKQQDHMQQGVEAKLPPFLRFSVQEKSRKEMPWHSGRALEEDETSQCRVPCFRGFRSRFVKETFKVMTKRKWEGRREGFKVNSTREEAQGPGRPSTRGRFSESWKRLSSRQGSTKRSGLASQQAAVRSRTASVCAPFFPVCWIWSKGGGCKGGNADGREEEQRTRAWDHTEMERGGAGKSLA